MSTEFLCEKSVHTVSPLFYVPRNAKVVCCSPKKKVGSLPVGGPLPSDGKRSGLLMCCSAKEVFDFDSAPTDANADMEEIGTEDSESGK